ncbi:MAG: cell division protein FtsZ [Proteobacteria bacterium]|nr:cell division protein FtsZ [Pseudomonadota bacterium]
MFEFVEKEESEAKIKVIGVGGGGGNAINTMIQSSLEGVEFLVANTDSQALRSNMAPLKFQLGTQLTKGLGAGANPDVGKNAAVENREQIKEILAGADMVFITAGMGGGTGTGAAPIIAEVAKEEGALTIGVVTKPFVFEGKQRMAQAEEGIRELKKVVDTLITIPNQKLLSTSSKSTSMLDAFKKADDVLLHAVKGVSDLITNHGFINVDFADVKTIMSETGMAIMGTGTANGESRALEAAQLAISSPLLEDMDIMGARGVLVNICAGPSLTMHEIEEANVLIQEKAHDDARIISGVVIDEKMGEEMMIMVIATGFGRGEAGERNGLSVVRPENRDMPAYMRKDKKPEGVDIRQVGASSVFGDALEDEYDIPTFLRKQAD